jgi:hypothetical protein
MHFGLTSILKHTGANISFFFISVQAIIKSFADSFIRIFVPMPFSVARP